MMAIVNDVPRALNRLAKWRMIFAGWQLGTRPDTDPETQAVRDQREALLFLRVEVSALVSLLIEHDVIGTDEWAAALVTEAGALEKALELRFYGARATDVGMDIDLLKAQPWLSKFPR